jgi:hypothetical protein
MKLTVFSGVHLTDLVFIEEGNPRMVGPRINFVRHRLVAQAITSILVFSHPPFYLFFEFIIAVFYNTLKQSIISGIKRCHRIW